MRATLAVVRRLLAAASISAILCIQTLPAAAAPSGRVVLVTLDGTRLSDWLSPDLPVLNRVLGAGGVALLSTRTAENPSDPAAARAFAYQTLGAGRISRKGDATAMLGALDRANVETSVVASEIGAFSPGSDLTHTGAQRLPERIDAAFPTRARVDLPAAAGTIDAALRTSRVVVTDFGDTARVEHAYGRDPARRDRWMRLAMTRADAFLALVRAGLTGDDTLIVASLAPPQQRRELRRFLSVTAVTGPRIRPGTLTSASTEREGVVTIADITATILDRAGVDRPDTMTGNAMRSVPRAGAPGALASFERALLHASLVRGPLMRGTVITGAALTVLALLTVIAGRGRSGRARGLPTTWRPLLDTGLIAVAAVPLVLLVEPLLGMDGLTPTAITVAAVAIGGALVLRAVAGSRAAITGLLGVTAVAILADLLAGGALAERSPLSYLIAEGARFHGIGNDAMGVVIGAALFSAAAFADRLLTPRRILLMGGALALAAGIMVAPQAGAKFGAVPAAVPAFALLVFLATGRRFDLRAAIGIAIVTILTGGLVVAVDLLRETGTHVAQAVGGGAGGEILGRKAGAAGRLLALSYWMGAIIACAGSLALIAWRRPSLLGRGLWGRPTARRALACAAVAAAGCIGANDAGVTAAAWVAFLAAASVFSALLVPTEP